jgi:uncharacterized protein (TIGR02246 family)
MKLLTRLILHRLARLICQLDLLGACGCAIVAMAPVSACAQVVHAVADTAEINSVVRSFSAAWGRADAAAIAALFTPDGDLVIPTGLQVRGRAHLRDFYASAFARGYAGSTTAADIRRIQELAPGVMVIDATWSINGAKPVQGKSMSPERGILAAIIVKTSGKWRIAALREQEGAAALTLFEDNESARVR